MFWDQWDFYKAHFDNYPLVKFFTLQHGPHRQGIGFVLTKYLDEFSGWNTRVISFTIGLIIFSSAFVYLLTKKQFCKKVYPHDAIIFIAVLTPIQHEIFTNTPNISHGAMPAFLLSLACLSFFIEKVHWRCLTLVVLNFNMIFSGFGIFFGAILPLIFISESYFYYSKGDIKKSFFTVASLVVCMLSFVAFFVNYDFDFATGGIPFVHLHPWEYIHFCAAAYSNLLNIKGTSSFSSLPGGMLLVLIIFALLCHLRRIARNNFDPEDNDTITSKIIVVLATFSLLFIINTAIGRVSMGIEGARASRYVPYLIPSLVGLYFHLFTLGRSKNIFLNVMFVATVIVTSIASTNTYQMSWYHDYKTKWKETYLEHEDISLSDGISGIQIYPRPEHTHLKEKLNYLKENKLNLYLDN